MKPVACWLLLCCISTPVLAQTETVITIDITMTFIAKNKLVEEDVIRGYLRCYKEYIIERVDTLDRSKIKKPADVKPPFLHDTSFYFINTGNQKFVHYTAFSAAAKPTAADDLEKKPLGIRMTGITLLDSASRITDTTIAGIKYIRYQELKERKSGPGKLEVTAYLLPVQNTTPYSFHRKTELAVQGRIAWVQTKNLASPGSSTTTRFTYETRKIPSQHWKVMESWISRTKW